MEGGVYHQSGGVEGIGKHSEYGQIEGSRLGLVHHEGHYRLGCSFVDLHLRHPGTHAPNVAAEGIGQEILPCTVELELLGLLCGFFKGLPGQSMHLSTVAALIVAHEQLQIIAAGEHPEVDQSTGFLGLFQLVFCNPD